MNSKSDRLILRIPFCATPEEKYNAVAKALQAYVDRMGEDLRRKEDALRVELKETEIKIAELKRKIGGDE